MTVEKMFWDVWRNVTSATTGWSLGGNSSSKGAPSSSQSAQRTRYNRLKSSGGRPTKSISQPANLTGLCSNNLYSSSESLEGNPPNLGLGKDKNLPSSGKGGSSGITPKGDGRKFHGGTGSSMKHSISSFFPFTSCTSTNPTTNKTCSSQISRMSTTESCSTSGPGQQTESLNNGVGLFSNICDGGSGSSSGGGSGNSRNKISLRSTPIDSDNRKEKEGSSWDQHKKEIPVQDIICEDDISDLDDDVEHLTCDVCDRAFPTLKQLAAHQRKKRHYGCLQCDSIFPSREVLEFHREQMSHYDYVIDVYEEGEDDGTDFFESEDDEHGLRDEEDCDDEERERLL